MDLDWIRLRKPRAATPLNRKRTRGPVQVPMPQDYDPVRAAFEAECG